MIESVQRHFSGFTQRLRGLHSLSCANELVVLNTNSLEWRHSKIDLITMYKIVFVCCGSFKSIVRLYALEVIILETTPNSKLLL